MWHILAVKYETATINQWELALKLSKATVSLTKINEVFTVIFLQGIRVGDEDRLWGVRIRLLPYPRLLGFNIQLAKLKVEKTKQNTSQKYSFLSLNWKVM